MNPFTFGPAIVFTLIIFLALAMKCQGAPNPNTANAKADASPQQDDDDLDDEGKAKVKKAKTQLETEILKNHRIVNWCVTGRDELELHQWPFNQFVPLIKKNLRYKITDPDNNRYSLKINEIYSRVPWDGAIVNCDGEQDPEFSTNPSESEPNEKPEKGPWCDSIKDCQLDPKTKFCKYKYVDIPPPEPPLGTPCNDRDDSSCEDNEYCKLAGSIGHCELCVQSNIYGNDDTKPYTQYHTGDGKRGGRKAVHTKRNGTVLAKCECKSMYYSGAKPDTNAIPAPSPTKDKYIFSEGGCVNCETPELNTRWFLDNTTTGLSFVAVTDEYISNLCDGAPKCPKGQVPFRSGNDTATSCRECRPDEKGKIRSCIFTPHPTGPAKQFPQDILYNENDGTPDLQLQYVLRQEIPVAPNCDSTNVHLCRPKTKNPTILKYLGRLFKTVHISVVAEERRRNENGVWEKWLPQEIEGVILQANHNPDGVGLPHGEFFDGGIECLDCEDFHGNIQILPCRKRPAFATIHPTIAMFHHEMKVPKLAAQFGKISGNDKLFVMKPSGKKSEVHVNYRWYSPACTETRRIEFTLLVVRSFDNADYDVLRLGPYETVSRGQDYVSDFIPTPIFHNFFYHKRLQGTFCHAELSPDISLVSTDNSTFQPFDMSHNFDTCVREELNPKSRELGDVSTDIRQYSCATPPHVQCPPKAILTTGGQVDYFDTEDAFGFSETGKCPIKCPERTTTPDPPEPEDNSIFRRDLHGGLLTMSNFCLMPIASFIGRFYKETWNVKLYKGTKGWFMAHIVASVISSCMIYIGTFHSKVDTNKSPHVVMGKIYILILAITYFTAWGRHKVKWCNLTLEFVHGVLGYCTTVLAHVTMHYAPGVSYLAKFFADLQMFIHLGFLVIMTYHIWKFDKMIGMKPRRRHFPTVEARFDAIPLPQAKFRITMIVSLAAITFALSFASLFIK